MDYKKLEDLLNVVSKTRKELWALSYEELDDIYTDLEDYLDEIEVIKLRLENGLDKIGEILDDFEEEEYWDEDEIDQNED